MYLRCVRVRRKPMPQTNFFFHASVTQYTYHCILVTGSLCLGSLYQPKTVARSGTNISLACGGVSSSSYIYLIEWVCQVAMACAMVASSGSK